MKHITLTAMVIVLQLVGQTARPQCNPMIDLGGAATPLCESTNSNINIVITGSNLGNSAGDWSGWSEAANGNATSAMFNPATEGPGVYNIMWEVTVADGDCMLNETATADIFVDADNSVLTPTADFFPNVGCLGTPVVIIAFPTIATFSNPNFNYSIDPNNTDAPGADVDLNGMVTATGEGVVTVEITETNGCSTSMPFFVTIPFGENPNLMADPPIDTICNEYMSHVILNTNYSDPSAVQFWLTDIQYSSADVDNPGSPLMPGAVGDITTSVFLPGSLLNEMLVNTSHEPQTVTYSFIPTRNDGGLCAGAPEDIIVTVMPTPDLAITHNAIDFCSDEMLDVNISSLTVGGGVTFDLIIEESEDPNLFPADLEDDQSFPIIIPELVASVGDAVELSDLATFITNKTGNFDPGRILLGMDNIRLTDFQNCEAPDVPPGLMTNHVSIIWPEPNLTDVADFAICSGQDAEIDISMTNTQTVSNLLHVGFPVKIDWTVSTSNKDGGITGASDGSVEIYDLDGLETALLDIDQTLTNSGDSVETATYTIIPTSSGDDGAFGSGLDCVGDTLEIVVTVNPEMNVVATPANPQTCSGFAFETQLTSDITPANGISDLEFLVTAISNTPNLGQGLTVIPNATVFKDGEYLTEILTNTDNIPHSVTYSVRAQLNSSRTDPTDPTSATCFGLETDITVEVFPKPTAMIMDVSLVPFCPGALKTLTGTPTGIGPFSHLWAISNPQPAGFTGTGTIDGDQSSPNAVAEMIAGDPGQIEVFYLATDANGCVTDTSFFQFIIEDVPDVEILPSDTTVCLEDGKINLTGTPTNADGSFSGAPGITDFGDGTAEFDPDIAGEGTHEIIYNYAPPGECSNSDTIYIYVEKCVPEVAINDPCACRENPVGSQGNATTLENGQFTETVEVLAPSNQTWYIAAVDGLYDIASPHPPFPLISFQTGPAGDTLVQSPAGVFTLDGVHVDGIGYEITVTNGTDSLTIGNQCFYPNPVIEGLASAYCLDADPVPLVGHANPSTGVGEFNIYDAAGIIKHSNATELDPAFLGEGTFTVVYTFDEDDDPTAPCQNCNPGCVQSIEQTVVIADNPGALACNDLINISLDDDCEVIVIPDMVLEGSYPTDDLFTVEIFQFSVPLGDTVRAEQIGKPLTVRVTAECGGNHCWGNLTVEDKAGPVFDCPDTLVVSCAADIALLPAPIAIDNCDSLVVPTLLGETAVNFGCGNADGIVRRVLRAWRATDTYGNQSLTCNQIIDFEKSTLADIDFPPDFDNVDTTAFGCVIYNTNPDSTGYPTIDGFPLDSSNFCSMNVLQNDETIQLCEGSFKILRTWTVFDWCEPSGNGNPLIHTQIIKVLDTIPPTLDCPTNLTIGMLSDCTSFGSLPPATVDDNCSPDDISVTVFTPNGNFVGNGGILTGLPIGPNTVKFQASDDCGNISECETDVFVIDNVPPTPICDEFTVVSLNSNGLTYHNAENFDDGSYDNCDHLPLTFTAKRMDDPGNFAPQVGFDCDDAGDPVTVIVKVTDYFGNENSCMVTVDVQSKNSPFIACPPPVTINCTDDLNDFSLTLQPTVGGNCEVISNIPSIAPTDDHIDDDCGTGFVIRTWTATDEIGQTSSCTQMITVVNNNPFDSTDIVWPQDTTIYDCFSMANPSVPGEPTYPDNDCSLIAVGFDDDTLTVVPDACLKIIREWELIDWCQFQANSGSNVGRWTHQQTVKVIDTIPPEFKPADCMDRMICNFTADCDSIPVDLSLLVADACTGFDIDLTWDVDLNADGSIEESGVGQLIGGNYPNGIHTITYTADDGCGNSSVCSFNFTIEDCALPTVSCQSLIVEIMQNGQIIVLPEQFESGSSMDNCTASDDLVYSFSENVEDDSLLLTCDNIGANSLAIWITDEAGNQDFCITTLILQDNMDLCPNLPPLVAISGGVFNEEDQAVNGVEISVNGNTTVITDIEGNFIFEDLLTGGDYTLVPEKNTDILNGVTTYDMALISKHILNIKKLDSPYKLIAADVNNSGTVTTVDLVHLRKAILHISDEFPNNQSWRFVDNQYDFPIPENPFFEIFPEFINHNNLIQNMTDSDFIGIKIGDVNGSANPNNANSSENRNQSERFFLRTADKVLEKGKKTVIDFFAEDMSDLTGFQFTIEFDPSKLSFRDILENDFIKIPNFGLTRLEEGGVLVSWVNSDFNNNNFSETAPLFSIIFESNEKILLKEVLTINSKFIQSEAYLSKIEGEVIREVGLKFEGSISKSDFTVYQNQPNPFKNYTYIKFNNSNPEYVTLKITDSSGRVLETVSEYYGKGNHTIKTDWTGRNESGLFIYQLQTKTKTRSGKMIRIP